MPGIGFAVLWLVLSPPVSAAVHHDLRVTLFPDTRSIDVTVDIAFPEDAKAPRSFLLHAGLDPKVKDGGRLMSIAPAVGGPVPLERLVVELDPGARGFTLEYGGEIHHPIARVGEEYARGFKVSPGLVSSQGVYLSGASYWLPSFQGRTATFDMQVTLPKAWYSMTQGTRAARDLEADRVREVWSIDRPQEEVYLIAGAFVEYLDSADSVETMVFLRRPDPGLAGRYLDATSQYLALYRDLIGPYAYGKFALVENFWETGYGMPSFTLLGPRVIRLPFILHSSYPHEILHNWWGNGVYVDYDRGNWAEGLTSYLADHLIKEQLGQSASYRRQALQKYADYVRDRKDFPLTRFRARHSSVTEAVGYGKTMMLFHMLRRQLGDDGFVRGLRKLYQDYRFRAAAFDDVRKTFEAETGESLTEFFEQWVERSGAPALRVTNPNLKTENGKYLLSAVIEQVQPEPNYALEVPVAVHLAGRESAYQSSVAVVGRAQRFQLVLPEEPLRLEVDPEFDVFRRLHRNEIPPALTQAFGAARALIVLPRSDTESLRQGYRELARDWSAQRDAVVDVIFDDEIDRLPADRAVWLFGWDNRFREAVESALSEYAYLGTADAIEIDRQRFTRDSHSVVVVARNPNNSDEALAWVAADTAAALPGLGRKLPHYGKYSYLAFSGTEPANVAKGQWPVVRSPMSVTLAADAVAGTRAPAKLAPRRALAEKPPLFSSARMRRDVSLLAAPQMAGRGLGSSELDRAADYIADQFRSAGLQPGGEDGSYFQTWRARVEGLGDSVAARNVIGILAGARPQHRGESVVVGAHYDHLGRGWPDVRRGNEGKVHPGADDNASGVAVMLELARALGGSWRPERSVVFVAFTGEEADKLGSRYYVRNAGSHPVEKVMGMVNLDTVGRLGDQPLLVLGAASAREWKHIFRGAGYVAGVSIKPVADDFGSSDQTSFLEHGVPAVQLFSGPNPDYHRPSDTAEKIDVEGMLGVAAVVKEALEYLASRPEALQTRAAVGNSADSAAQSHRRVLLGAVPDFAFTGPGVRLADVTVDSPAQSAGLQTGDVIVRLDDRPIANLKTFSQALKTFDTGDRVTVVFLRSGREHIVTTTLVAR